MEERRGRRYKEGDQMVQRGMIFGIFFLESSRENFYRRTESKKGWNREGRKLEEGVSSRGADLHSEKRKVAIWFIGMWARGIGNPSVS